MDVLSEFDIRGFQEYGVDLDKLISELCETPSFYDQPMETWNADQVYNFITRELFVYNDSLDAFEKFKIISGYIFQSLSLDSCESLTRSKELGHSIYEIKQNFLENQKSLTKESPVDLNNNNIEDSFHSNLKLYNDLKPKHRKPGRPRNHPYIFKNCDKKSEKLWEFIIHLLQDENTCPALIRWENFEEGTFKFVQNEMVAQIWGSRKKNVNMTYEKFSRAMRYYYKSQILLPVPGQRLVYKFGPQAKGWKKCLPTCA